MNVSGFEWDEGNTEKCQRHGVSLVEIERLPEAGRYVFIVFTLRKRDGRKYIRPISARYMHQKEVDSYEKENPGF